MAHFFYLMRMCWWLFWITYSLTHHSLSAVCNAFLLLSVSWWLLAGFEYQGRDRSDFILGLFFERSVPPLYSGLSNHSYHVDVITILFQDWFGESKCVWNWSLQVQDFDLLGVKVAPHGGGGWYLINLDLALQRQWHFNFLPVKKKDYF